MNRTDRAEDNRAMSTGRGEPRNPQLPSCFSTDLASVIATFCIGMVLGALGGLLLGTTAVVLIQSLELLDKNTLLVDQLLNYTIVKGSHLRAAAKQRTSHSTCSDLNLNFGISLLVGVFGMVSSSLSSAVGILLGFSTYSLVNKKNSEAAKAKALSLAGTVCLMGVTASGYALGLVLESFLYVFSSFSVDKWFLISLSLFLVALPICFTFAICAHKFTRPWLLALTVWILTPGTVTFNIILITVFFKTKLVLMIALIPTICAVYYLEYDFKLTPVALMLITTEIFNIKKQPIITLHSPTSTHTINVVHEAIFIGLFTSLLFTAAIGTLFFRSLQTGGAAKICAGAASSGAAVLGAVKGGLLVLRPGPTVGALVGVAGAVGVSLAAAMAATENFKKVVGHCGGVGRLGVTVGAAAGAFLSSCVHSGLSETFVGLCAAAIPAGLCLKQVFLFVYKHTRPIFKLFLCLIIFIILSVWFNFACTGEPDSFVYVILLLCECLVLFLFTILALEAMILFYIHTH